MPFVIASFALILAATSATPPAKECPDFPDKLRSCTPYKCTYTDPMFGIKIEHDIVGVDKKGMCTFIDHMPGDTHMDCLWNEATRKEAADYYKAITGAKWSQKTTMENNKAVTHTYVEGKEIQSTLANAINDGTCKITMPPRKKK